MATVLLHSLPNFPEEAKAELFPSVPHHDVAILPAFHRITSVCELCFVSC